MDAVVFGVKVAVIIAISAIFLAVINTLLGFILGWSSTTFMGEFFNLMAMYMPFQAGTVFGSFLLVCTGILSFLAAKKVFDLTSWGLSAT